MERHNDASKEWGALLSWAISPGDISYKYKINNRTVQGERNGDGARVAMGEQEGEEQDGKEGDTGQATVPDESRANVCVNGL